MRILVIPYDQLDHQKANVRLTPIIKSLLNKYEIVGIERAPYFNTSNEILKHIRFFLYSFEVIYFCIKNNKNIDLILAEHPWYGLVGSILSFLIHKPLIWDNHEGNQLLYSQFLQTSFLYKKLNMILERFISYFSKIIVVPSNLDKQLYIKQKFNYIGKIIVIPSGIDFSKIKQIDKNKYLLRNKLGFGSSAKILIFGGIRDYPPNKEAAFWINDKLAPVLAEKFNQVQIIITGFGEVPQKIHPIVAFPGHVPDYFEHILASDVCLVPYEMNTGISTKLIDYLACGRPTVTTVEVARLFPELVDGENVLIARDKKEFIEKTMAILENPVLGEKIGANGRKVIEEHYNMEVIGKLWQEVFESCVKR